MYAFDETNHIHTIDGKPAIGTTTLIKSMFPPMLTWWAAGKALEPLGWTNKLYSTKERVEAAAEAGLAMIKELSTKAWLELLDQCYGNHEQVMKSAGTWGTEAHNAIEYAVKEAISTNGGYLKDGVYEHVEVERFAKWGRGKMFIHSEVCVFSKELWLGGIVDLVYVDSGSVYMGDIKTSRGIYPSHFIQMGLYDVQQLESGFVDKRGNFIAPSVPISGYTVINIPKEEDDVNVKTYQNTSGLREYGKKLVESYKLTKELEMVCKATKTFKKRVSNKK